MVQLLSFIALSTLVIFTSALETSDSHLLVRELDEAEAAVFAREMQGLFARQHDTQYVDVARRDCSNPGNLLQRVFNLFVCGISPESQPPLSDQVDAAHIPHKPFHRHQFEEEDEPDDPNLVADEVLERNLDHALYVRDLDEADLFGRFYDDMDLD